MTTEWLYVYGLLISLMYFFVPFSIFGLNPKLIVMNTKLDDSNKLFESIENELKKSNDLMSVNIEIQREILAKLNLLGALSERSIKGH